MDKLTCFRLAIKEVIEHYAQFKPSFGEIETEMIFDETSDHYHLVYSGWNDVHRVHGSVLHLDIRNGKIWIQHDGTEDGVAEDLVEKGVLRDHIVLAFKHPSIRPHTDYATA